MGTVFKHTYTKPLPKFAERIDGVAFWRDGKGRKYKAPLTEKGDRIVPETKVYYAEFIDGTGERVRLSTGHTDKMAALDWLREHEKEAERVRRGIVTQAELNAVDHFARPTAEHVAAYLDHLRSRSRDPGHIKNVERQLARIIAECGFARLRDLDRSKLETWSARLSVSVRTRNGYLVSAKSFAKWCTEAGRMLHNPFAKMKTNGDKADRRRVRRQFTPDELARLFAETLQRPVRDQLARLPKAGDAKAAKRHTMRGPATPPVLKPATREALERLGRERVLIYRVLVETGRRLSELAGITVGQVYLTTAVPYIELAAADSKGRKAAQQPLPRALAADLRVWLADRLAWFQGEARASGGPVPESLPPAAKLFTMPAKLSKILNRDLKAAGIVKKDHRGRVLDVHSFRHTYITTLAVAGVPLKITKELARHERTEMTMNVYSHAELADRAAALVALDALQLGDQLGETSCKPVHSDAFGCQAQANVEVGAESIGTATNPVSVNENGGLAAVANPPSERVDDGTRTRDPQSHNLVL